LTTAVGRILSGEAGDIEAVVAAVQWIAPWAMSDASDEIILAALDLAEQLPAPADALWLWWLASRYPDMVALDPVLASSGLSDELVELLEWSARRGSRGLTALAQAQELGKDYFQALRELEREARDYPTLEAFITAIGRGDADLGPVFGSIPGAYDSPAYRHAKSKINYALAARDDAVAAGLPLDLPPFRRTMLRVPGAEGAPKELALQILSEISGAAPFAEVGLPLRLEADLSVVDKVRIAEELRARGLPVDQASFGTAAEWATQLASPQSEVTMPGPGAAAVNGLHRVMTLGAPSDDWWASLLADRGFWGTELASAFSHADQALADHDLEGARLSLMLAAEAELPNEVGQMLRESRRERRPNAAGGLALQRLVRELNDVLSKAEDVCTW